jgi:quinol monooxygenase YgiN
MIIVTLSMTVRPERRHEFKNSILGMLAPTRNEPGCISYCLYEDIENKNSFTLVEEWKTRDDLETHVRTDNYRKLLTLMNLLSVPPKLRFSSVSRTTEMELMRELAHEKRQKQTE